MLHLTRRQMVLYMEHLNVQLHNDSAFQAKLHGFKMAAPAQMQKWSVDENKKLEDVALRRFNEMQAGV